MKGLSALVSTIILIAFAVAIGGLVALWLTGFATDTTGFTGSQGNKLTQCAGIGLKIESVTDTGIVVSNPGINTITNITIYDQNGRNLTYNFTNLAPAQVANITWARAGNSSIASKGICQGNIPIDGGCAAGQSCWK